VRRRAFLITLAAAAILAGCGSTANENANPDDDAITAGELIADFGAQADKPALRRSAGFDGRYEQLSLGLDPPPELLRRYGTFSIYVVEPGQEEAKTALLTNKTTGEPLEPDERGIYWEYDDLSNTWIANSVYGENVVLVWFTEKRKRMIDGRWERLHDFLSKSAVG
jgi:hypothetical protein